MLGTLQAEAGKELLERYEREAEWDDESEEWNLPNLSSKSEPADGQLRKNRGNKSGGGMGSSGGSAPDGPPTNIGNMDPDGFSNQFANDILGDSDDDSLVAQNENGTCIEDPFAGLDAQANGGGSGGRKSRNQEFQEPSGPICM